MGTEAALSAFDHLPAAVVAFAGADLQVAADNRAARDLIGGRSLVGWPAREALVELDSEPLLTLIERVQASAEPLAAGEWRVRRRRPNGTLDDVLLDVTLAPWHLDGGPAGGVLLQGSDVTAATPDRRAAAVEAVAADRAAAAELQGALLPRELPVLPGIRTAVRHLPAGVAGAARGDWFDVIPRPDGTAALVVGDVVGRGVAAAAAAAGMRCVLAERLGAGEPLAGALAALDAFAATVPAGRASSVCLVALDAATGRLDYCTAGHPPPLVAGAGRSRFLAASGSRPLGVGAGAPRLARAELAPHEMVLLHSDGVLARPDRTPMQSTAELVQVVAATFANRALPRGVPPEAVERVCVQIGEMLTRVAGHTDDVTLLAAQRVPAAGPLHLELPTEVDTVRLIRPDLALWLLSLGAGSDDVVAMQHAVGEVVTNAVVYGRGNGGCVVLHGVLDPAGVVHVDVVDDGQWVEPDPTVPFRGNGLAMAALLSDELTVRPGQSGTAVRVSRRLHQPLSPVPWRFDPVERSALRIRLDSPRLVLQGAVDVDGAQTLRDDLLRHTRAGTVATIVELGGLTHLCSAGVQVLYEAVERAERQGRPLRLHAPAGSIAAQVLTVAALAHDALP